MQRSVYRVGADFFKPLGHPARIRILEVLREEECQVAAGPAGPLPEDRSEAEDRLEWLVELRAYAGVPPQPGPAVGSGT